MRIWTHAAGYAAVMVVLSAGAAQSLTGTDTVFTDDIAPGAVTKTDIRSGAVTGGKVLDGSLTGADLAAGSVGSSQLGATWSPSNEYNLAAGVTDYVYAACPSGMTAISGAARSDSGGASIFANEPVSDAWVVWFKNWDPVPTKIRAWALCVPK